MNNKQLTKEAEAEDRLMALINEENSHGTIT